MQLGVKTRPIRGRALTYLGLAVGFLSIGVMLLRLAPEWDNAMAGLRAMRTSTAVAVAGSILLAELWFAVTWARNTRSLGGELPYSFGIVAYFYSGLSRFLPGAVVPYVARTALVSGAGTSALKASVATGLETILSSVAALTLAFIGLSGRLVEYDRLNQLSVVLVAGTIVTAGIIAYRLLPRFLRAIGRGHESVLIPPKVVFVSLLSYTAGWLAMGWGVSELLGNLTGTPVNPLDASGALALAWFAGFIVVPVPGGLGVREAVIAGVLAGVVGVEVGIVVAFVHRIAWSLVISITGAIALVIHYRLGSRRSGTTRTGEQ